MALIAEGMALALLLGFQETTVCQPLSVKPLECLDIFQL